MQTAQENARLSAVETVALKGQNVAALVNQQRARNVVTVALPAYTYVAGTITGNAFGAMGAQDGIVNGVGDTVFLPAGIAAALVDAGAYEVIAPGTAATLMVLRRTSWMPHGAVLQSGFQVRIGGESVVFQNTTWEAMNVANTFTVGTTDARFFPLSVSGQSVLVAGTFPIANIPILSLLTAIALIRTNVVGVALTVAYQAIAAGVATTGITPGNLGTGAIRVEAAIAAGTINVADGSTLNWTISNQNV